MTQNQCCPSPAFSIYTGDAKTMQLKAIYSVTEDPVDLTNCTQIVIKLPNADGTFLELELDNDDPELEVVEITSPPVLGKFTAPITAAQSALLNPGELQNFFVTFTIASEVFTVNYAQSLSVFESP